MGFDFEIVLRNKQGVHLENLKKHCARINWRYEALGGCTDCDIVLRRDFDSYGDIDLDYPIQIFETVDTNRKQTSAFSIEVGAGTFGGDTGFGGVPLPAQLPFVLLGSQTLRYSGFVREIVPVLSHPELVNLRVSGWSRQLEYISVTNKSPPFGPMVYANQDVGAIARSIIDTFILPGCQIRRSSGLNLCQNTGVTISSTGLSFDTTAWEALKALADIGGNAEFGVNCDREIYFLPRTQTVKQTWIIGDRIEYFEPSKGNTDEIVHTVYLQGANGFRATLSLAPPESGFYKERTIAVPSIANTADAILWGVSYASRFATAKSRGRLKIAAIDVEKSGLSNFIERQPNQSMPPLGLLRVLGAPSFLRAGAALPFTLPQQLTEVTVGGTTNISFRINSILYTPIDGGLSIDIELGEKGAAMADLFRGIEQKLSEVRQLAA